MAWRLKDKKLEAELNKLSNGEFSKRLNEAVRSGAAKVSLTINDGKVAIFLDGRDLERVPEYNPNTWNEYPAVTPPENILMRAEIAYASHTFRVCVIFKEGVWYGERNGKPYNAIREEITRFRPWGDPE